LYAALLRADPATMNKALLNNAAYARQQLGDLAAAEALARRALAIDPNDPVVQDTTSWILFARYGATPEAVRLSRRARARMGNDPDVRQHGARIEAAARRKLNAPAA
ncbi:MAG: Tetratricopeptide repeat, partial [Pseudomonadota bacterium]